MITPWGRQYLDDKRVEDLRFGEQIELPWGGRSPRVLTIAYKRFRLEQRATTQAEFDEEILDEQYRRFLNSSDASGEY